MTCDDARASLLDYQRERLPAPARVEVHAHLDTCPECARAAAIEHALTTALEERLPQHPASLALKRRLAAGWPAPVAARARWSAWRPAPAFGLALAAVLLVLTPLLYYERLTSRTTSEQAILVSEAVNDHLRVLSSQHPLDVESGGIHQVKPWFEGRLDFAPVLAFEGDAEFPLRGGSVGYFRDRKAAVLVYTRRLHLVSLIVFRAENLAWPAGDLIRLGSVQAHVTAERGFNVIAWRRGDLGYALVSDVDARELRQLAARM